MTSTKPLARNALTLDNIRLYTCAGTTVGGLKSIQSESVSVFIALTLDFLLGESFPFGNRALGEEER